MARTIKADASERLDIKATQHTNFSLTLNMPMDLGTGIVKLTIVNNETTIDWQSVVEGRKVTFSANYDKMTFPTGVYSHVITYEAAGARINLFTGNFIFKPRF